MWYTHLSDVCGEDGNNPSHCVELVHQRLFHLACMMCVGVVAVEVGEILRLT